MFFFIIFEVCENRLYCILFTSVYLRKENLVIDKKESNL